MCPKFTTSIAKKTISYYLLKNVPLKESILEVLGHVWTRDASIWSTLRLLFEGYKENNDIDLAQNKKSKNGKRSSNLSDLSTKAWWTLSLK